MDQSTHEIRRANWLAIVKRCQERPSNVTVKQWLEENGIRPKSYYYWLRKFRQEAYEQMQQQPIAAQNTEITFAELPVQIGSTSTNQSCCFGHAAAVIKAKDSYTVELSNSIFLTS